MSFQQKWVPVSLFGANTTNILIFDNRTRNERFPTNTPADFSCDFAGKGINLGTGEYGIILDEISNNKPLSPWNTQYPVINNFYDHPTDLCGDSLISFQGLMWNSIGFYQNLWADSSHVDCRQKWYNRSSTTNWEDIFCSQDHISIKNGWDVPSSDFMIKTNTVGQRCINNLLLRKQILLNDTSNTDDNTIQSGEMTLRFLYSLGRNSDRNTVGIIKYWPKINDTRRTNTPPINKGIYTRMSIFFQVPYRAHSNITNANMNASPFQFVCPIINSIASSIEPDKTYGQIGPISVDLSSSSSGEISTDGNVQSYTEFQTRCGNLERFSRDNISNILPKLKPINERESRRYCSITGLPYGIICPTSESVRNLWRDISAPYWEELWSTPTSRGINSNTNLSFQTFDYQKNIEYIFPLRNDTTSTSHPNRKDKYTLDDLEDWYKRDIINICISSLQAHGSWYQQSLQSLFNIIMNKIDKINFPLFTPITFLIPNQTELEDTNSFQFLHDIVEECWKILQSLGLLHTFYTLEQPGLPHVRQKDAIPVIDGALVTNQYRRYQYPTQYVETWPNSYRELYFPFLSPDYLGVDREIKLSSDTIKPTFRGSFTENIFDTWVLDWDAYKTITLNNDQVHLIPPDPVVFHFKANNKDDEMKVIPIIPETIDAIHFNFSNERGELYPFESSSTTTIKLRFAVNTRTTHNLGPDMSL